MPNRKNTEEGFWALAVRVGECLEWQGPLDKDGYGRFSWRGKLNAKAHRVAWAIKNNKGELPAPEDPICHTCDNPKCIEPSHVYLGTPLSNVQDRDSRGRKAPTKGILNGYHKLTETSVREIRERYAAGGISQKTLGRLHGVSQTIISRAVNRQTWSHVQ